MNKTLFTCLGVTIRVREVVITLLLIILLFFGLKACQNTEMEKAKKEAAINNICEVTINNINQLTELLKRADLCSKKWFDDFNVYIEQIEEQNQLLQKKANKEQQELYTVQNKLLISLKNFKKVHTKENIDDLEVQFTTYLQFYNTQCKGVLHDEKDKQ